MLFIKDITALDMINTKVEKKRFRSEGYRRTLEENSDWDTVKLPSTVSLIKRDLTSAVLQTVVNEPLCTSSAAFSIGIAPATITHRLSLTPCGITQPAGRPSVPVVAFV